MPMITVKFDDQKVTDEKVTELSNALIGIVQKATGIESVFVYADSARIKIGVAPIEVFIEISAWKMADKDQLFEEIKTKLSDWKKEVGFDELINLTLMPMEWKFEVGI